MHTYKCATLSGRLPVTPKCWERRHITSCDAAGTGRPTDVREYRSWQVPMVLATSSGMVARTRFGIDERIPYYFDRQFLITSRKSRSMTQNGGDERSDE